VASTSLMYMRIAEHAVINETVSATHKLNRRWAKGLVNAVLRNFQRQRQQLVDQQENNQVFQAAHPKWLLNHIRDAWGPELAEQIIAANNQQAPMMLRINRLRTCREDYLAQLAAAEINCAAASYSAEGILLTEPRDVSLLPEFANGYVSVQDEAAQLAAPLLMLEPGQTVLDACCAPGGKTCHILESQPDLAEWWLWILSHAAWPELRKICSAWASALKLLPPMPAICSTGGIVSPSTAY